MAERIGRREFVRRLAERMQADEATAAARLDGMVEEMDLTHRDYRGPAGTWEAAVRASLSQDEK